MDTTCGTFIIIHQNPKVKRSSSDFVKFYRKHKNSFKLVVIFGAVKVLGQSGHGPSEAAVQSQPDLA